MVTIFLKKLLLLNSNWLHQQHVNTDAMCTTLDVTTGRAKHTFLKGHKKDQMVSLPISGARHGRATCIMRHYEDSKFLQFSSNILLHLAKKKSFYQQKKR